MDLTEDEVHRIIRIIDTLQYGDIDLEYGDLKISIQRGDVQPNSDFPPRENIRQGAPRSTSEFEAALQAPEPRSADDGFHEVRSPVNGIFFSAPSPGAPTFVEIGSTVGPEDPVCLVEVMKLFNTVPAGVRGRIVDVRVTNGEPVKREQVLIRIDPISE